MATRPEPTATPDPAVADAQRADAAAKANGAPNPDDGKQSKQQQKAQADKGAVPELGETVFWKDHNGATRPAIVVGVPREDMQDQHTVTLEVFGMPVAEGSRIVSGTAGKGPGQWSREKPSRG